MNIKKMVITVLPFTDYKALLRTLPMRFLFNHSFIHSLLQPAPGSDEYNLCIPPRAHSPVQKAGARMEFSDAEDQDGTSHRVGSRGATREAWPPGRWGCPVAAAVRPQSARGVAQLTRQPQSPHPDPGAPGFPWAEPRWPGAQEAQWALAFRLSLSTAGWGPGSRRAESVRKGGVWGSLEAPSAGWWDSKEKNNGILGSCPWSHFKH